MSGPGVAYTAIENALQAWVIGATGLSATPPDTRAIWAVQNHERPQSPFISMRLGNLRQIGVDWLEYSDRHVTFSLAISAVVGSTLTSVGHGRATGDGPTRLHSTGSVPTGADSVTDYWLVVVDADHLRLATSFQNAKAGTTITLSSAGSGTITVDSTSDTVEAGKELNRRARGMRTATFTLQAFATSAIDVGGAGQLLDAVMAGLPVQASALRAAGIGVTSFGPIQTTEEIVNATYLEPRAVLQVSLVLTSEVADFQTIIERAIVTPTVDGVDHPSYVLT